MIESQDERLDVTEVSNKFREDVHRWLCEFADNPESGVDDEDIKYLWIKSVTLFTGRQMRIFYFGTEINDSGFQRSNWTLQRSEGKRK